MVGLVQPFCIPGTKHAFKLLVVKVVLLVTRWVQILVVAIGVSLGRANRPTNDGLVNFFIGIGVGRQDARHSRLAEGA